MPNQHIAEQAALARVYELWDLMARTQEKICRNAMLSQSLLEEPQEDRAIARRQFGALIGANLKLNAWFAETRQSLINLHKNTALPSEAIYEQVTLMIQQHPSITSAKTRIEERTPELGEEKDPGVSPRCQ